MSIQNPVVGWVRARLWRNNLSWIVIIYGKPGSGKSYSALRLAEEIDRKFTADNICFTAREFLQKLDSGEPTKGRCFIIDEAGTSFSNRAFMTRESRDLSAILQIVRDSNLALILTLPALSMLDLHGRMLASSSIETIGMPNRNEGFVRVKFKLVDYNPAELRNIEPYGKFPRVVRQGERRRISVMRIFMPSDKFIRTYEEKKREYKKQFIKDALNRNKVAEVKESTPTKKELIEQALNGGIKMVDIAKNLDVSYNYVQRISTTNKQAVSRTAQNI